jgi:hypothetical protein
MQQYVRNTPFEVIDIVFRGLHAIYQLFIVYTAELRRATKEIYLSNIKCEREWLYTSLFAMNVLRQTKFFWGETRNVPHMVE